MEESNSKSKKNGRREMLKMGIIAGAATLTGAGMINLLSKTKASASEKIKVLTSDGKLVEVEQENINNVSSSGELQNIREGIPGKKFVMVIDLARCGNERTCIEDCQKMHKVLPPTEYIKVKRMKDSELGKPYWFPQLCYQCDNPPCTKVCPVDATFKRSDGIVAVDPDRCVGCKFCMAACPYSSRTFNFGRRQQVAYSEQHKDDKNCCTLSHSNTIGTVSKCDFCPEEAAKGKLPACVTGCPNGTIFYGDENEDTITNGEEVFQLSELIGSRAGYRQFETLGTKPRVYYLPQVKRNFPFEEAAAKRNNEE